MEPAVRYVAEISPVREVTLLGTADLEFWTRRLEPLRLFPAVRNGRAQLVLSAIASQFKGVRFSELAVTVVTCDLRGGENQDGFFLLHAFNSSRFFACVERHCFSTPYEHARVLVDVQLPVSLRVEKRGEDLLWAEMSGRSSAESPASRAPSHDGDQIWEGPIYLPHRGRQTNERGKKFFAKLAGPKKTYPFTTDDRVTIQPSAAHPILQALVDSHFTGHEWGVRENGTHARSKTIR